MNSTSELPYRHSDVRDRQRLLKRLGQNNHSIQTHQAGQSKMKSRDAQATRGSTSFQKPPLRRRRSRSPPSFETQKRRMDSRDTDTLPSRRLQQQRDSSTSIPRIRSRSSSKSRSRSRSRPRSKRKSRSFQSKSNHYRQRKRQTENNANTYRREQRRRSSFSRPLLLQQSQENADKSIALDQLPGFWFSLLQILLRVNPFVWTSYLRSVTSRQVKTRVALDETKYENTLLDESMRTEESRLEFRELVSDLVKQLQQFRPDESSLYRVYVHTVPAQYAFAIVQPSTERTTFYAEQDTQELNFYDKENESSNGNTITESKLPSEWEGAITVPGSLVYFNPQIAACTLPMIGDITVPYQLPDNHSAITDIQWQQYVLHGAMQSRSVPSGSECMVQLSRVGTQNFASDTHRSKGKPLFPKVRKYTVPQPIETFIREIDKCCTTITNTPQRKADGHEYSEHTGDQEEQIKAPTTWGGKTTLADDIDDDPLFVVLSKYTGRLRRSLQTPYFVSEFQFLQHWTVSYSTQFLFPRDILIQAFQAKQYVFDDLYVLWFILVYGPTRKTEEFIVRIYQGLEEGNVNRHMILPAKPPHVYLEEMLTVQPCDPFLQRWYLNTMSPRIRKYINGDTTTSLGQITTVANMTKGGTELYQPSAMYSPTSPGSYCPTSPPPPPPATSTSEEQLQSQQPQQQQSSTMQTTGVLYSPSSPQYIQDEGNQTSSPMSPRYTPQSPAYSPSPTSSLPYCPKSPIPPSSPPYCPASPLESLSYSPSTAPATTTSSNPTQSVTTLSTSTLTATTTTTKTTTNRANQSSKTTNVGKHRVRTQERGRRKKGRGRGKR